MKESASLRSRIMRAVKGKDTAPEMSVRRLAHRLGYRFRLHSAALPGKPDIVFPSRRKVIFVHGCFWHGHTCPRGNRRPKTNSGYWLEKIGRNKARDHANAADLRALGWRSLIVWECQMSSEHRLAARIRGFLNKP